LEFIQLLIFKKLRGLFLFKRNEKKNRKGTLTPKKHVAARFSENTLYRKISLPKLLMCDGSTALMNAIGFSIFKETFKKYLDRCWLIASGKYTSSFCELPILHLCARHFMKNAKRLVKER